VHNCAPFAPLAVAAAVGAENASFESGSFVIPLMVAGSLCVVGALSCLFVVGKAKPLPLLARARTAKIAGQGAA